MRHPDPVPSSPVTAAEFRQALGHFVTGVTVVTALAPSGRPEGMTVNAFTSLSLEPPLVLVCLTRATRLLPIFESATHFAVNVLSADQRDLSVGFSRLDGDRFHAVSWRPWTTGAPVLDGCVANLECLRTGRHDGGDHVILVGQVERLAYDATQPPLLFARGDYHRLGTRLP
jgi:flavin reductase (DIM6/NTAB) family NADH-FMN oxidoreductase RutF